MAFNISPVCVSVSVNALSVCKCHDTGSWYLGNNAVCRLGEPPRMREHDFLPTPLASIGPLPLQRKIIGANVTSVSGVQSSPPWGPNVETDHVFLHPHTRHYPTFMTRPCERGSHASTFLGRGLSRDFYKTYFYMSGLGTSLGIVLEDSGHSEVSTTSDLDR